LRDIKVDKLRAVALGNREMDAKSNPILTIEEEQSLKEKKQAWLKVNKDKINSRYGDD
jgi:hypothetical protein